MLAANREQLRRYANERGGGAAGGLSECVQHHEPPLVWIVNNDDQAADFRWVRKEKPNGCVWWVVSYSLIIAFATSKSTPRFVGLIAR